MENKKDKAKQAVEKVASWVSDGYTGLLRIALLTEKHVRTIRDDGIIKAGVKGIMALLVARESDGHTRADTWDEIIRPELDKHDRLLHKPPQAPKKTDSITLEEYETAKARYDIRRKGVARAISTLKTDVLLIPARERIVKTPSGGKDKGKAGKLDKALVTAKSAKTPQAMVNTIMGSLVQELGMPIAELRPLIDNYFNGVLKDRAEVAEALGKDKAKPAKPDKPLTMKEKQARFDALADMAEQEAVT